MEKWFSVHHVMQTDGADINAVQAIKLSQVANTSIATVRKEMSIFDKMKALVNYTDVFKLE